MSYPFGKIVTHNKSSLQNAKDLPPVRLTNPAIEFIENHVKINGSSTIARLGEGKIVRMNHGSLVEKSESTNEGRIVKPDVQPCFETNKSNHQFIAALELFEKSLPPKHKTHFDIRAHHSWEEVIQEAKIAEMKYKKKGEESPFGKVRGWFRTLQSSAGAVDDWMDVLPAQSEYTSVICGGFKIILRAAVRMGEIRDFVVMALAAIPDEMEKARLMMDYHQGLQPSQRLYDCVTQLYVKSFQVLEHLVNWYSQHSGLRQIKALVQQSAYEKALQDKVDDFKQSVQAVKGAADLCSYKNIQDIRALLSSHDIKADEQHYELSDKVDRLEEILQGIYGVFLSNPNIHQRTGQFQRSATAIQQKKKAISRGLLCDTVLRYEEDTPQRDLKTIMEWGSELTLKEQDRAVYVIENPRLKEWLVNPRNSSLLIRGSSTNLSTGICAMSFIAAHLIRSSHQQRQPEMRCLYWFAGQHRNVLHDADANVHGIMRSLIGQLVNLCKDFDLYFIKRSTAVAIREENDLGVLCDVFDELVYQLIHGMQSRSVTFCVIDSLACLEYKARDDVLFLVQRLRRVATFGREKGKLFKLLLTHDGGAFRAATEFTDGDILFVPEDSGGNRMGFNKLMWNVKVGREMLMQ